METNADVELRVVDMTGSGAVAAVILAARHDHTAAAAAMVSTQLDRLTPAVDRMLKQTRSMPRRSCFATFRLARRGGPMLMLLLDRRYEEPTEMVATSAGGGI